MSFKKETDCLGYMMKAQNYSVNDGEGIRTVLFLAGCPLRCKWCCNPESFTLESKENFVSLYTIEEILKSIENQKIFYRHSGGGVTFSGGEATVQVDFLRALVNKLYDDGVHLAIETSGYFKFEDVEAILSKMDQIFVDVKLMDDDKHIKYTGKSNRLILENIKRMNKLSGEIIIRIPVIAGVNDSEENSQQTARYLRKVLDKPQIELLPYHSLGLYKYELLGIEYREKSFSPPTNETIKTLENIIKNEAVKIVSYM